MKNSIKDAAQEKVRDLLGIKKKSPVATLTGLAVGITAGTLVAALFAPRKGTETQSALRSLAKTWFNKLKLASEKEFEVPVRNSSVKHGRPTPHQPKLENQEA